MCEENDKMVEKKEDGKVKCDICGKMYSRKHIFDWSDEYLTEIKFDMDINYQKNICHFCYMSHALIVLGLPELHKINCMQCFKDSKTSRSDWQFCGKFWYCTFCAHALDPRVPIRAVVSIQLDDQITNRYILLQSSKDSHYKLTCECQTCGKVKPYYLTTPTGYLCRDCWLKSQDRPEDEGIKYIE